MSFPPSSGTSGPSSAPGGMGEPQLRRKWREGTFDSFEAPVMPPMAPVMLPMAPVTLPMAPVTLTPPMGAPPAGVPPAGAPPAGTPLAVAGPAAPGTPAGEPPFTLEQALQNLQYLEQKALEVQAAAAAAERQATELARALARTRQQIFNALQRL